MTARVSKNMASKPRNPHPENSAPITDLDLEAQIILAERAVVTRDARIRRRTHALVDRVKHDALRHASGGLLAGIGTLALTWWLKRRYSRKTSAPVAPATQAAPSEAENLMRDAGLSIAGLLPLVWPMLPRSWRRSIAPGTASTVLTFVAPLVARFFRRKPKQPSFR
jgi:hypothetical protein